MYNNETTPSPMDKAVMVLPDAIFCHKFMAILGKEEIGQYLFDKDFEVTSINMCTNCIPYRDTCIDCCIEYDQQIFDALSSNKKFKSEKYIILGFFSIILNLFYFIGQILLCRFSKYYYSKLILSEVIDLKSFNSSMPTKLVI